MFDFSRGEYDSAVAKLTALLGEDPENFDAQLSLGVAYYRKGDYATAIAEGLRAEKLRPREQLVHTNLSLFYMKAGDKVKAEHHGLQARIAGWREDPNADTLKGQNPDLQMARPQTPSLPPPGKFPDMPWKRKPPLASGDSK